MALWRGTASLTATANNDASGWQGSDTAPASKFGVTVVRSAGSTDVVDIDLETLGDDGTTAIKFSDVLTSVSGGSAYGANIDEPVARWRVKVPVVGAGNTLLIKVVAME